MATARDTAARQWSGSPCPLDPANFWQDDETGERVALDGTRRQYTAAELAEIERIRETY